jgi:exopolysaccharide biosynthesis polyprenyl glycosylphosphotransferase
LRHVRQNQDLKLDLPHSQLNIIASPTLTTPGSEEIVAESALHPLTHRHATRRIHLNEYSFGEVKENHAVSEPDHAAKPVLRLVPEPLKLLTVPTVIDAEWLPSAEQPVQTGLAYVIKRLIDITGALVLLVLLAIPMLIVAIAIKLDSSGPLIFRQIRVGKHGKVFTFYKFRSMYTGADARLHELQHFNETQGATFKMKNDPRITKVGRFIRRSSLDELPQLFNVLAGQMSLVGPRPGLVHEAANYRPAQYRRLAVTPGLTGLWQVSGRSSLSFEEMVILDIYYVENWSLWLDLKILFRTLGAVIRAEGAY